MLQPNNQAIYNSNVSQPLQSFERASHTQTNPDWDGYSFTEKIDPEEQGYAHPEATSSRAGWLTILGGLAALLALIATIFALLRWLRCRTWERFWYLILTFVGLLVAAAVAGLSSSIKTQIKQNRPENPTFSTVIYILSALLAVFFFVAAIFTILGKPFAYSCVQCNHGQKFGEKWGTYTDGYIDTKTIEDAWRWERIINNVLTVIYFILAFLFAFIAFTIISISKYLIELNRGLLAAAGFFAVLTGLWALAVNNEARAFNTNQVQSPIPSNQFRVIGWTILAALIVTFLALIFNIAKKRIIYFFCGVILLITAIILIGLIALHTRELRVLNDPARIDGAECIANLQRTHEKDIARVCPAGKYLPAGKLCRKEDIATRWEGGSNQQRSLNPAACSAASAQQYRPMYNTSFWAFLLFGFLTLMAGAAFFLSDTTEFMEIYNKKVGILELAFLGLALLLLLIPIIWYKGFFSPKAPEIDAWAQKNLAARKGTDPGDNDWKIVAKSIGLRQQESVNYYPYNPAKMPSVKTGECPTGKKCGFRVAVLATNAELLNKPTNGAIGEPKARYIFFKDCDSANDDFLFLKGDEATVNAALEGLDIKPRGIKDVKILYDIQKVDLEELDGQGLKIGESISGFKNPENPGKVCPDAPFKPGTICTADCKYKHEIKVKADKTVDLIGKINIKKKDGQLEPFKEVSKLDAKFYQEGNLVPEAIPLSDDGTGVIGFKVPVNSLKEYRGTIVLVDKENRYLPNTIDVTIPKSPGPQVSYGNILLITRDGKGCEGLPDDEKKKCFADKKQVSGNINVLVVDASNDKPLADADVQLKSSFSVDGNLIASKPTDANGKITFENIPIDYVNFFAKKEGFQHSKTNKYHTNTPSSFILYAFPDEEMPIRLNQLVSETSYDHDLLLDIRSKSGKECTVSQANKYCAYAEHKKAVAKGNVGYEIIDIYNLTESTYLLYEKVSQEDYNGANCPEFKKAQLDYHKAAVESKHFWDRVGGSHKVARILKKFWSIFCFTGFGWPSVKHTNKHQDNKPTVSSECIPLYGTDSPYNLDKLGVKNTAAIQSQQRADEARAANNADYAKKNSDRTWWNPFN